LLASPPGDSDDAEARLHADAELCRRFREQKYQGPDWEQYVEQLLGYGISRMRLLVVTGIIFEEKIMFGRTSRCSGLLGQPAEIDELINDVVLAGFAIFFRKGLIDGRWSPTGGASLTTYFVGACKLAFKDQYEARHKRHHRVADNEHLCNDLSPFLPERCTMPDDHFEELLDLLTSVIGVEAMEIFKKIRDGYLQKEIAATMPNATEKSVERLIARARAKARPFRPEGWRDK
jgi:DNA-directed RNA polymerase specialized sigma24 family protein